MFVKPTPQQELNFDYVWNKASLEVKSAFIQGIPKKVKLEKGFQLYKFTGFTNLDRVSPWWSPVDPYEYDAGLNARIRLARMLGVTASALTRVVAAVAEDWNPLMYQLVVETTEPMYAFWGQCKVQNRVAEGKKEWELEKHNPRPDMKFVTTKRLPGFAWQFYIPNIRPRHVKMIMVPRRDFNNPFK